MKKGKEVIAEIELDPKYGRLYLIHKRGGREASKTDVTSVWHFFKGVQEYLQSPASTPPKM